MIVYGSRSKELAKDILTDQCPNCGKQNSIDMHVFQKYAHVFWIPFFPMGKTGVCQCDYCKQVLTLKEMPASLAISYENLKARAKTPIWMFSGLAVLAILITIGFISDKQNDEENARLILMPQAGDVFEIKLGSKQYTLYKVAQVAGDSVFVQLNNYETNKVAGLNDLKKETYSEEVLGFSKAELKQMLEKGEIIDIERN
jgi:hypothetical protein